MVAFYSASYTDQHHSKYAIAIYLHFLLAVVTSGDFHTADPECSRLESRKSLHVLTEFVEPLYTSLHTSLSSSPTQCPWNPSRNMFGRQESRKSDISESDWLCTQCGKRFYNEYSIDLHMDNRHRFLANTNSNAVCLASYCPILRCDILVPDYGVNLFWDADLCEEEQFIRLRRECNAIAVQCVDEGGAELIRSIKATVCDQLTCDRYWVSPHDHHDRWIVGWGLLRGLTWLLGCLLAVAVILVRSSSIPYLRNSSLSFAHGVHDDPCRLVMTKRGRARS